MIVAASNVFQNTLDDIIRRALRMVGATRQVLAEEWTAARLALHSISNNLTAQGFPLWKVFTTKEFLPAVSYTYYSSVYYKCIRSHTSSLLNAPDSAEGNLYWIVDEEQSTTTTWAVDTEYTSPRVLEMESGLMNIMDVYLTTADNATTRVKLVNKDAFMALDREDTGLPTKAYFEAVVDYQAMGGFLHLYPEADLTTYTLSVDKIFIPHQGMDTGSLLDIPPQWVEVLTVGLAADLSYEYGIAPDAIALLERKAKQAYENIKRTNFNNSHDGLVVSSRFQ